MINVSQYTCVRKEGIYIITVMEDLPCPCCEGFLFVHGTCRRSLKTGNGKVSLRLRVMECRDCGTTHRETPGGIVPYKRYSARMLCFIFNDIIPDESGHDAGSVDDYIVPEQETDAADAGICDISVRQRIIEWLSWFFAYAQSVEEKQFRVQNISGSLCAKLRYYVRFIVNSGKWIQHRFAMLSS